MTFAVAKSHSYCLPASCDDNCRDSTVAALWCVTYFWCTSAGNNLAHVTWGYASSAVTPTTTQPIIAVTMPVVPASPPPAAAQSPPPPPGGGGDPNQAQAVAGTATSGATVDNTANNAVLTPGPKGIALQPQTGDVSVLAAQLTGKGTCRFVLLCLCAHNAVTFGASCRSTSHWHPTI